jgi:c-di-GMP-binding flagellar brake protein YcgR
VVTETREEQSFGNEQRERRTKRRFEIAEEVRYKMLYGQRIAEIGSGKTMNISSGGVWFTTENILMVGMPIELSMNWPVLLNDSCPMKLMIYGCVIRSNEKGAVVAIERYEFRTQGSRTLHQPSIPTPVEIRLPG